MASRLGWTIVACAVLAGAGAGIVRAQEATPAELRREIETLRESAADITRERDALREQVESLAGEVGSLRAALAQAQARVAELEAALAARPAQPATPTEQPATAPVQVTPTDAAAPAVVPATETPLDPLASPESMRLALTRAYLEAFGGTDLSTDAARSTYRERLASWIGTVKKNMRGQTRWNVLLSNAATRTTSGGDRALSARMQVLHPQTGAPIGPSFMTVVPARLASKVSLGGEPEMWEITITVWPDPHINDKRLEVGAFNHPEFVGPMLEFGFAMEWVGMRKLTPATVQAPAAD